MASGEGMRYEGRRVPRSESEALGMVEELVAQLFDLLNTGHTRRVRHEMQGRLYDINKIVRTLRERAREGIHVNPPLLVWGPNPPRRGRWMPFWRDDLLSERAYALAYRHVEDGKDYKHDFASGVDVVTGDLGGTRAILLYRPDGKPLWKDF